MKLCVNFYFCLKVLIITDDASFVGISRYSYLHFIIILNAKKVLETQRTF